MMKEMIEWCNLNSGFLGLILFAFTLLLGWITGIFKSLRNKPEIKIELIEGPSFVCTFKKENEHEGYPTHKTGIALYLKLTNTGNSPTCVDRVMIGYRCNYKAFTFLWLKYNLGRLWLKDSVVALSEFGVDLPDGRRRVYPFLIQSSPLNGKEPDQYLRVGDFNNGIVYFEQDEAFGGHFPFTFFGKVYLKVKIKDTLKRSYTKTLGVPMVGLERAKVYYKDFGTSIDTFSGMLPPDHPIAPNSLAKNQVKSESGSEEH